MAASHIASLKALKKLVKEKATTEQPLNELRALLDRAKKVTTTRNDFLHSLWAEHDGKMIMDGDEGAGPAPSVAKLTQFYGELTGIVMELNESRLRGDLTRITGRPIKKRREKAPED